ncbi:MAG TPA: aspartate aminotransferase family protein [Thermoanaerobaculia bacterium]|nr:aspartate aminotransferase family protein [Thermoanaerobaculia bacterium]
MSAGDQLPRIVHPPPGPRSRALALELQRLEAPGVNTVAGGAGAEPPILWDSARGANVHDVDGNRYVDLTSGFGVAAVGHRHPRVVAAVRRQAGRLLHGLGDVHAHPLRVELAARLVGLAPVDEPQVFFATSGAEAVEIALETALAATGRPGIVAFEPSYHGLTLGALAVTSRPAFRAPFAPYLHPHVRRIPFGCPLEAVAVALAATAGARANPGSLGPSSRSATAGALGTSVRGPAGAVLVEPIVGREGVLLPPPGWLAGIARLCREAGAVLIADEIFTGFGRTGRLFAVEAEGVRPDILCCGKALGGGLPIAAVLARRSLLQAWRTPGEALRTSTFLANPVACAASLAVLDVLEQDRLPARATRLGAQVAARLAGWSDRLPAVAAVRGRGLLWGVELRSRQAAGAWVAAARRRGVLILAGGPEGRVAQLVPPLTIAEPQLTGALDLLEEALAG